MAHAAEDRGGARVSTDAAPGHLCPCLCPCPRPSHRYIYDNPRLAHISPQAFQGAVVRFIFKIVTSSLHCCGAEWLAYGVPGQPRLTLTGQ